MPSNDWIKRREEIEKLENKIDILEENILDLQKQLIESYKRIKELSDKGTIQ
jgi:predicted  nucleic acid-binding Zn-ribbon protein